MGPDHKSPTTRRERPLFSFTSLNMPPFGEMRSYRSPQTGAMPDTSTADMRDAIEAFIHDGQIEEGTLVYDIAQQVLAEGFDALSPKQVRIFEGKLRDILRQVEAE